MASSGRIFFAGVATTFVILAIGFGAGLMLAKASIDPPARSYSSADPLPPVRVILPTSAEPALPSQKPVQTAETPPESQRDAPVREANQASEKEGLIDRSERRKAEVDERGRRKKMAERKARREAARLAQEQERQQRSKQQASVLAFGQADDQPRGGGGFFGQ
jgi:type IV secretory pathway VirB10-like protein